MTRKYTYLKVIQQHFGGPYGWEDVSIYECNSTGGGMEWSDKPNPRTGRKEWLMSHDLREYKTQGYPTRVIFRRLKN